MAFNDLSILNSECHINVLELYVWFVYVFQKVFHYIFPEHFSVFSLPDIWVWTDSFHIK